MILSVGAFVRTGGLLLLAVVLQVSAFSQLTLFGGPSRFLAMAARAGMMISSGVAPSSSQACTCVAALSQPAGRLLSVRPQSAAN